MRYTLTTINTGNVQGKIYANIYLRLVDRKDRTVSADAMSAKLRERLRSVGGINVTHVACWMPWAATNRWNFRFKAPTCMNWSG